MFQITYVDICQSAVPNQYLLATDVIRNSIRSIEEKADTLYRFDMIKRFDSEVRSFFLEK